MKSNMKINYDNMTNDEILELFKNQYYKIKPSDAADFFKRSGNIPSYYILKNRLGLGWTEALIKIDVKTNSKSFHWKRKDLKDYIKDIRDLTNELGRIPSANEVKKYKNITVGNLKKICKLTYNEFLDKYIDAPVNKTPIEVKESDKELLEMYKNFCKKLGRVATGGDLNESKDIYNASIFTIRFNGMGNLRRLAGYNEYGRAKKRYTKIQFMEELKKLYIEHERKLTYEEMLEECKNNIELPESIQTISTYFKTTNMSDVWEEVEHEMIKDYIKLLKKDKYTTF